LVQWTFQLRRALETGGFEASGWLLAGTGGAALFSYVAVTLSARLLGPENFGLLGALIAITSLVTVALTWLYTMAAHIAAAAFVRDEADRLRELTGPALAAAGAMGLASAAVLAVVAGPIGDFLHITDSRMIELLAPLFAAIACTHFLKGLLSGLQRFRAFGAATALEALIRAILTAPLALLFGVAGSLAAYVGGVIIADAWMLTLIGRIGWRLPSRGQLAGPGWTAVGTVVTTLMVAILQYGDIVLLRWYAPAKEVGIYSAAAAVGNTLFTLVLPLTLPAFPRALAAYQSGHPTWPILLKALIPVVFAGLATVGGAVLFGEAVGVLIFGVPFVAVGALLPVYFAKTTALVALALIGQHTVAVERMGALVVAAVLTLGGPFLLSVVQPVPQTAALINFAFAAVAASVLGLLLAMPRLGGDPLRQDTV
jgi:O-antigen/teichoic acid export membrane protein